jgi:hypothetical protein
MTSRPPTHETVEALVRHQLSVALGGRRGMVEAALPTLTFTLLWLSTKHLTLALTTSLTVAGIELLVRLVQRQTVKFCVNALVGIGIGWFFVHLAASRGVRRGLRPHLRRGLAAGRLHDRQRHR